jgi:hypothetical protein
MKGNEEDWSAGNMEQIIPKFSFESKLIYI